MAFRGKKVVRRIGSVIRAIGILKNWHVVLPDLFRIAIGLRPSGNMLQLRNGLSFLMYPHSIMHPVFLEIFCSSVYDNHPLFTIKSRDIVVDIGAHVGFFTLKAASRAEKGTVYAFEPFPSHFAMLKTNVERNRYKNIVMFNCAIWGSNQEVAMSYSMHDEPFDTSMFKIGGDKSEVVSAMTLEEAFRRSGIGICDFLKIDCEGAEYNILYNTPDHILRRIRKISMEWHRFDISHDPEELVLFLISKGFHLAGPHTWAGPVGHMYLYQEDVPCPT